MNSTLLKKSKLTKYQDGIALLCLIVVIAFFVIKAQFGFGFDDESFYLTFSQRLILGQSLLTDEWHVAQLIGFLLYLPTKLYISVAGSTEGIILFFRYLFIAMQSTVSIIIYCRLRRYGFFSIFAAIIFYLHIPLMMQALSYNTMGLAFITLTGLILATTKKHSKATLFLAGLFMACAVLSIPASSILYFIYTLCMFLYEFTKNKKHKLFKFSEISFSFKTWLWITLGIFTVASIFAILLFSRTNLKEIIANFPMLFTDPEYNFTSSASSTQNIFDIMGSIIYLIKINIFLTAAYIILMIFMIFDKRRIEHRLSYLSCTLVIFFTLIIYIIIRGNEIENNIINILYLLTWTLPLTLLGLTCYVLSTNKDKNAFVFLWLLGVFYAFCLDISSALGTESSCAGLAVSNIASVVFINNLIVELHKKPKGRKNAYDINSSIRLVTGILTFALFVQIIFECYVITNKKLNFSEYLLENSNERLNVVLQTGPEKGLKTTATNAKRYNDILSDLSEIKENNDGAVLIAAKMPWCYIYLNMPYATHSTWFGEFTVSGEKQRLIKYYNLHPENEPKYVYIPQKKYLIFGGDFVKAEMILSIINEKYIYSIKKGIAGDVIKIISSK